MTGKRFIVIDVPYENGEPFLYKKMLDKTTKKEYDNTLKGIDDICDLANKLHEECQRLKQENAQFDILIKNNQLAYIDLEKENEQLKLEYQLLHTQYHDLRKFVENNFDEYMTQEKLNRQIIKLSDENEQLKQKINDLRISVLDSIHEADEIQCTCNPCVVEECVKRVVE